MVDSAQVLLNNNQLSGTVPSALTSSLLPLSSSALANNCIVGIAVPYAGCSLVERAPLLDLYFATSNGTISWTASTGWATGDHPCTWLGVTCTSDNTAVVYVEG